MTKLGIITGYSHFNNGQRVVAVAIPGDVDPHQATQWARSLGHTYTPATVHCQGDNTTNMVTELKARWDAWANDYGVDIEWGQRREVLTGL